MELIICPICGNREYIVLFRGAIDRMHGIAGTFRYVKCKNCEHVYLNPRPEIDSLKRFYPISYNLHQALKKRQDSPITRFTSPIKRAGKLLRMYADKHAYVLDIGCGRGDFLDNLRRLTGCQCFGIDFSDNAAKIAKELYSIDVFRGQFLDARYPDKSFNLITMWWYLEHDPNPLKTLSKCKNLLKDDGMLVFSVPNYASLNAKLFKAKWYHLDAPRHLSIYSPKTVKFLLEKSGFRLYRMEWDRSTWGLTGSLQYLFLGRSYNAPFNISENMALRMLSLPITFISSLIKMSDTITIYAVKDKKHVCFQENRFRR